MLQLKLFVLLSLVVGISAQLYRYTSHTFTSAGASGRFGPTLAQLQASYSPGWAKNSAFLYMGSQGYQKWVVPATGKYEIRAAGASGGKWAFTFFS